MRRSAALSLVFITVWLLRLGNGGPPFPLEAGEVHLKNGMTISGTPVPIQSLNTVIQRGPAEIVSYPILMIETGLQRYFVPNRQVLEVNYDADLSLYETFTLDQKKTSQARVVQSVGAFLTVTPFDEFGRRRVTLQTPNGPMDVIQGITQLHPRYVTVTSLNCAWQYGIATTSLPPETLDQILRRAIDPSNPQDRLAVARFYLQAGMFLQAQRELTSIRQEFPELKDRVDELSGQVRELVGQRLVRELRQRQRAGQHFLAYTAARQFPSTNLSGDVLRQVRELIDEYEQRRQQIETCKLLLGELQAQLTDPKQREAVAPMRSEVIEQLNYESLSRLDAFLKLQSDPTLSAAEKLALAFSGWVVGSAHAVTDLNAAIRLWEARFCVLEYLRSEDEAERGHLLATLHGLEGIGFETVLRLIPLLPPQLEPPMTEPGVPVQIEVPTSAATADRKPIVVRYWVLLPHEYHPHHRYPAVVALHAAKQPEERELRWWGGSKDRPLQSQRRGYIVIAPEYASDGQDAYDYSPLAHYKVIQALRDARKRFRIDSDRVFLAGHGMGADAAFDIGMSHPDLFAGVIPIAGQIGGYCKYYTSNGEPIGWYVVSGERDGDKFDRNAFVLNRMLKYGYDLIFTEYVGRGHEWFYEEIHNLFDWMDLHRRPQLPKEIEVRTLRPTDNRFFWLRVEGFPKAFLSPPGSVPRPSRSGAPRPMRLEARVAPGDTDRNVVQLRCGTDRTTIWLNPDLIDFDKRVVVRLNGRQRHNKFLRPDLEVLLEDLRLRGDRERLFWARLDFD